MRSPDQHHRAILQDIAHRVMLERGFLPDFSAAALDELGRLQMLAANKAGSAEVPAGIRDLRSLPWASIDNDNSRDLDQLTVAEALPAEGTKIMVAIADVDSLVKNGSAIDEHARHNTTSIYTAAEIFPMLPEKLSTDLTSLNPNEDRLALVVEVVVGPDGSSPNSTVYRAQCPQSCQACLQQRCGVAGGQWSGPRGARRRARAGREPSHCRTGQPRA